MDYLTREQFIQRYPDWYEWTSYQEYLAEYQEHLIAESAIPLSCQPQFLWD